MGGRERGGRVKRGEKRSTLSEQHTSCGRPEVSNMALKKQVSLSIGQAPGGRENDGVLRRTVGGTLV